MRRIDPSSQSRRDAGGASWNQGGAEGLTKGGHDGQYWNQGAPAESCDYQRRVEAGETIEVTDRGRPIALLTPIPAAPPIERLRASGDIEGGRANWDDLHDWSWIATRRRRQSFSRACARMSAESL